MAKRTKKRKAPKGLPGRYLGLKSGRGYYYIVVTRGGYKLRSMLRDVTLGHIYSEAELRKHGRILKNKPSDAALRAAAERETAA